MPTDYPEYEYGQLTLSDPAEESIPTFTFESENDTMSGVGKNLIGILNQLGKNSWELVSKESKNAYLLKREIM